MRSKQLLYGLFVLAALVGAVAFIGRPVAANDTGAPNTISAELIGQVLNPTPALSAQYGYVSYLTGLDASMITAPGATLGEQSALLTFYNHTATERVITNGPMRVIDRSGEATFYINTTPAGDFGNPETFRQGIAVMAATLRHQVVIDTLTGAFSAHFDCTVARNEPFTLHGASYRLGEPGQHFEVTFHGHLNAEGPPSAHMAGYITGLELHPVGE
jgi:hypothetical protein